MPHEKYPLSQEAYLATHACSCPFCGSDQIEGFEADIGAGDMTQESQCNKCGKVWHDHYQLVRYEEVS